MVQLTDDSRRIVLRSVAHDTLANGRVIRIDNLFPGILVESVTAIEGAIFDPDNTEGAGGNLVYGTGLTHQNAPAQICAKSLLGIA